MARRPRSLIREPILPAGRTGHDLKLGIQSPFLGSAPAWPLRFSSLLRCYSHRLKKLVMRLGIPQL